MSKLCILLGMTLVGWLGWWLGAKIGIMTALLLSGAGNIIGIYIGWRIYHDYLE